MNPLTSFVVGDPGATVVIEFELAWIAGSPNVRTLSPLPPLNRNGLRRLARHLAALAELIDAGEGYRAPVKE